MKTMDITESVGYYIPTIEEFHQGFEYELQVPEKRTWSKEIFHMNESHMKYIRFVNIQDEQTHNKVRVKHLDHEGIISLKFEKINTSSQLYVLDDWALEYWGDHKFSIEKVSDIGRNTVHFAGIIKNKSELQRLMKQIGIV